MNPLHRNLLAGVLAASCIACQPAGTGKAADGAGSNQGEATETQPAAAGSPAPSAAEATTPPLVDGMEATYACGGDELHVVYAQDQASVTFADGRTVVLPRVPQARSVGGGEIFAGNALTLRRSASSVELQEGTGIAQSCIETSATA
jgi:membrane-bound inhibitor of C-type lysozyme